MNRKEIHAIKALRPILVKSLETNSVINFLYSKDCINRKNYRLLKAIKDDEERCIDLLDQVLRQQPLFLCSQKYINFIPFESLQCQDHESEVAPLFPPLLVPKTDVSGNIV